MTKVRFRYVLRCKSCLAEQQVAMAYCPACNKFSAHYRTNDPDSLWVGHALIADCCGAELPFVRLLTKCSCGSDLLEWYDNEKSDWHQPDLSISFLPFEDAIWITGDCEADFSCVETVADQPILDVCYFNGAIQTVVVRHPVQVDGPPLSVGGDEHRPFKQELIKRVLLEEVEPGHFVECSLADVRLHRWEIRGSKNDSSSGKDTLLLRLHGKLFGRLVSPHQVQKSPATLQKKPEVNTPDHAPADAETPMAKTDVKAVESLKNTWSESRKISNDDLCLSCNLAFRMFLAGFIWLLCGFPLALLDFVVMGFTCLFDSYLSKRDGIRSNESSAIGWLLLLLSLWGLGWYLMSLILGECRAAGWWPLAGPALALILSPSFAACKLRMGLLLLFQFALILWGGATMGGCHSQVSSGGVVEIVTPSPTIGEGNMPSPVTVIADNGAGTTLGTAASSSNDNSVPTSASLPSSNASASETGPAVADATDTASSSTPASDNVSSDSPSVTSNPDNSILGMSPPSPASASTNMPVQTLLTNIAQVLGERIAGNSSTNMVSQINGLPGEAGRIGVNDASRNPELIEDCRHAIYFPNDSLFDRDRSELRPLIVPQMQKLASILQKFPNDRFVISGHADQTGDSTPQGALHNMHLSERRAAAVANWLVQNAGIGSERIEIQGAGTRMPITNNSQMYAYNRRVEVKLRCRNNSTQGGSN